MTPKTLSQTTVLLLLITQLTAPFAQATGPIPDEIDYGKYESIYTSTKQISDQKRDEADQAANTLQSYQTSLADLQAQLDAQNRGIIETEQNIRQASATIDGLRSQNGTLSAEISQHQAAYSANQGELQRERANLDNLNRQLQGARVLLGQITDQYNREAEQYQGLQRRLENAKRDRDQAAANLNQTTSTLQIRQNDLAGEQRGLQTAEGNVRAFTVQVDQLTPQVAQLSTALAQVNAELAEKRREVEPLKQKMDAARAAYNSSKADADRAQAALNAAIANLSKNESDTAQLQAQVPALKSTIEAKQKELAGIEGQINALTTEQNSLNTENAQIDARLQVIGPKIMELRKQQGVLSVQIDQKTAELAKIQQANPADPRIPDLQKEIENLRAQREVVAKERLALEAEKNGLDQRKNQVVARIREIASALATLRSKQSSLPGEILSLQRSLDQAVASISQLQAAHASLASEVGRAKGALASAQSTLASAQSILDGTTRDYNAAAGAIAPLEQKSAALTQQYNQKNGELTNARNGLAQATASIPILRDRIQRLGKEISDLQAAQRNYQVQLDQYERAYNAILVQAQTSYARLEPLRRQVEAQAQSVDVLDQQERTSAARIQDLVRYSNDLQAAIQSKSAQIAANEQNIRDQQDYLVRAQRELPLMRQALGRLTMQVQEAQRRVDAQQVVATRLDQDARRLEATTLAAYQEYITRKNRYDRLLADATNMGDSQGSKDGTRDGSAKGDTEGRAQGTSKGTTAGTQQGLADGLRRGNADGDAKGYAEGRAKGEASVTDYQTGLAQGIEAGKNQALAEADRVDLPRGMADRKKQLQAKLPTATATVDNQASVSAVNFAFTPGAELMLGFHSRDSRLSALTTVQVTTLAAANCMQTYVDFKRACEAAYSAAYSRELQESYQDSYERAYAPAFEDARKVAFDANKNVRYKEGYDASFPVGHQRGMAEGTAIAQNRGLADGTKQGYASTIVGARDAAYKQGIANVDRLFATSPVLEVVSGGFLRLGPDGSKEGDLVAGDVANLKLQLANFGAVASKEGATRVEIESVTPNLAIENKVADLVSVPAQTLTTVENILALKVLPSAAKGSIERVAIKVTLEDGRVVKSMLEVKIAASLMAEIKNVSFNTKPKVGTKYSVTASVSNIGVTNTTLPTQLLLTTSEPATDLQIVTGSQKIAKISAGKFVVLKGLSFKVMNAGALARGLKMKLVLKHGVNTVSTLEIVIPAATR